MSHKTRLTETNHMRKLMGLSLHEQKNIYRSILKQVEGLDVNEVIKQLEQQKISAEEKREKDLRIDKNAQEILRNFYDTLYDELKIKVGKFFEDNEEELNNAAEEIKNPKPADKSRHYSKTYNTSKSNTYS